MARTGNPKGRPRTAKPKTKILIAVTEDERLAWDDLAGEMTDGNMTAMIKTAIAHYRIQTALQGSYKPSPEVADISLLEELNKGLLEGLGFTSEEIAAMEKGAVKVEEEKLSQAVLKLLERINYHLEESRNAA